MKLSKQPELSAVSYRAAAPEPRPPRERAPFRVDPTLDDRLGELQELLGKDLAEIEATLASAVLEGPAPATEAAQHLVSLGGKRVRPTALLLSAACFGPIAADALEMAVVVELVHSATLLHDDVIDDGQERRGSVVARRVYGNAVSVLSGDMLLVSALERTQRHAVSVLSDLIVTLRRLVNGEIVQLRGRTQLDLTKATYEHILREKTASLFGWATRTGAALNGATSEQQALMQAFGEELGVAFQLIDDVLDYSFEATGKTLFADLAEGKLTLPLVLAVEAHPELTELLRRIYQGDPEPVEHVSRVVVECGACGAVRERAQRQTHLAIGALQALRPSRAKSLLIDVALKLSERAR